jgi:hypothetical protein
VAEDSLGLAFGRRLMQEHSPALAIWRETNTHGCGAIRRDVQKYDQVARSGLPVLALTDLDSRSCCSLLFDEWLGKGWGLHQNMLLRICVREAESWLMADPEPLARLLRVPSTRIPLHSEDLDDPKRALLDLAVRAPARVRKGLLPDTGSTARIGPDYNALLCPLVATKWDIAKAATRAPSLAKARQRIAELAARVTERSSDADPDHPQSKPSA